VAETPAPAPASGGSITEIIYAAAAEFGLSGEYLLSVASCESGLDPQAYNPAGYHGLFQFDQQTWAAYGYGSIYDPVAQARTAARLLAAGQASRWPNCA
jgi:soluble lytic murein transglycosylase-like protein